MVDKDQKVFGNALAVNDTNSNTFYSNRARPRPIGLKGGWQKQKIFLIHEVHAQIVFKT